MKMIRRNNFSTTFYFLFPNAQKTIHAQEGPFRNMEEYTVLWGCGIGFELLFEILAKN